ncbi:unnamed protein product [Rhizophagus irregularis]|nr:unnamed protein product [Rhizophagus irregularis]
MIGCFILGSGTSFIFEIGAFRDFTELSKAFWEKNKDYFINTGVMNELNLKLWNVEIPTRNNKKYLELKNNPRVDIDVEQEFGDSLEWSIAPLDTYSVISDVDVILFTFHKLFTRCCNGKLELPIFKPDKAHPYYNAI